MKKHNFEKDNGGGKHLDYYRCKDCGHIVYISPNLPKEYRGSVRSPYSGVHKIVNDNCDELIMEAVMK